MTAASGTAATCSISAIAASAGTTTTGCGCGVVVDTGTGDVTGSSGRVAKNTAPAAIAAPPSTSATSSSGERLFVTVGALVTTPGGTIGLGGSLAAVGARFGALP